jgi:hypothetical protein
MHDYIINASTIRECNFAMGTIIAQALVHTVYSTPAFGACALYSVCTCACAKPLPKIVPMAKLGILIQWKIEMNKLSMF